jgi:hypothetical protein
MELVAEQETRAENNLAQPTRPLSHAKADLQGALKIFQDFRSEIESNQDRLAKAQKEERDLLAADMEESEQLRRLSQTAALQRLLESKIGLGTNRIESSEVELRHAVDEAFRAFWAALSALRDNRTAKHLARLKEMVGPEQWTWAEVHALSFVRFASDLMPLDMLGDQSAAMLRAGAVKKAAEELLMDIAKLEAEMRI